MGYKGFKGCMRYKRNMGYMRITVYPFHLLYLFNHIYPFIQWL